MHPILFTLWKLNVYSYGLMVALGIISAMFLIEREASRSGLAKEKIVDLVLWIVIWGLVGARLFYVVLYPDAYMRAPLDIFKVYEGGLVFFGSLFFGIIAAFINFRNKKLPVFKTLDILMLYLPLAHAFGRVGCFFNGCCFGKSTSLPWGIVFPGQVNRVHPTQLYSVFLLLIIFLILNLIRRRQSFTGQIFSAYLILYGLKRFLIEFVRDNPVFWLGFSIYQYIGLILVGVGIVSYVLLKKASR